tara:strand:- start:3843 stop:4706 length:864 start_codon:yes stop_codon:yes gene_type:complete
MNKVINLNTLANLISVIRLKNEWKINDLLDKANINYDDLIYFLNILSEIYSKNGEYFFDFELDTINNKLAFNNSSDFLNIETITDLELFKIYTLLNNIDIDLSFENISKIDLKKFKNILKNSFSLFNFDEESEENTKKIKLNNKTFIEYIKLGDSETKTYEIEPLIIKSNNDGSILEALDIEDNKLKTFLINRIVSVNDNLNKTRILKKENKEIEVIFQIIDKNLLQNINNYKNKNNKNEYSSNFRNKNIAVEFFLENFNAARVISPDEVKVDVMKRIKSIKKLIAK